MVNEQVSKAIRQSNNKVVRLLIKNRVVRAKFKHKFKRELKRVNQQLYEKIQLISVLSITNQELNIQNNEKNQRITELIITHKRISAVNEKFLAVNEELILQAIETEKRVLKLTQTHHKNRILNEQLNHMQKLESISRLTSGIAHYFNNILGCVLGYNEMNQDVSDNIIDESLKAELESNTKQIDVAGKRATELIGKMLTYCRQDTVKFKIDVKPTVEVIDEVLVMLRPALTSEIEIQTKLECAANIQIDVMDLRQILTELVINARDAMKECGGIIVISLQIVRNVRPYCVACAGKISGNFIELSVTDNGSGIEPDVISRMFDPFFTTKEQGERTGLGLSIVNGIVHRSQGHILVDSTMTAPNPGTTFRLLFPILTVI